MSIQIGKYELQEPLTNNDAGFSQWGIGTCDGKEYFIKEFLQPVWPTYANLLSEEIVNRKKRECFEFEKREKALFGKINHVSDGNLIRVDEFFRYGSKYFIATEALKALPAEESLRKLTDAQRRYAMLSFTHSLACLHKAHLVHGDLKLSNVLFTETEKGGIASHIIDIDGCFSSQDPLDPEAELAFDEVYASPELFLYTSEEAGDNISLTEKSDVFSAAIILFQILTGRMLRYTENEEQMPPGVCALNGQYPVLGRIEDTGLRQMIRLMLDVDPEKRPDMAQVYTWIAGLWEIPEDLKPEAVRRPAPKPEPGPSGSEKDIDDLEKSDLFIGPGLVVGDEESNRYWDEDTDKSDPVKDTGSTGSSDRMKTIEKYFHIPE